MKVFVDRLDTAEPLEQLIERALRWLSWEQAVRPGARVFLKPNLTWREPMPGVTTTPAFIGAVARVLRGRGHAVVIGEAEGGYHSFRAADAFETHGLHRLARELDVEVVNLSDLPRERVEVQIAGRQVSVELPGLLLHDIDVFVTLPVPKVHAMTHVSLGFKNQWGCQPDMMRLRNHPDFARKVLAINKALRVRFALFDGTYFLDRTGPMIGVPVPMGLLIASDDVGAGTLACCEIMGMPPTRASHLRLAIREGMMPASLDSVQLSRSLSPLRTHQFRLDRSVMSWVSLAAFKSRFLTHLFYDSTVAVPVRRVLYRIRRHPLVGRLLYGPVGPPAVTGGRRAE